MNVYPLTFRPLFKERVWGGRRIAELFGRSLPEGVPIGESWELSDRPEGVSVIANGPWAGRDLRWLMDQHGAAVLGRPVDSGERFPWLVKILDARDDLSLQVHPPPHRAADLRGEPKTELWYFAATRPGARIYAGLNPGVSRKEFEQRIRDGSVAGCFHVESPRAGDAMFVPSGRVHALGAGNVVFEIQQNSDTTYRVFDWNRPGLDGRPRELHIGPSLESVDFSDVAPGLVQAPWESRDGALRRALARHDVFRIDEWRFDGGTKTTDGRQPGEFAVILVAGGRLRCLHPLDAPELGPGDSVLIAAELPALALEAAPGTTLLHVTPSESRPDGSRAAVSALP